MTCLLDNMDNVDNVDIMNIVDNLDIRDTMGPTAQRVLTCGRYCPGQPRPSALGPLASTGEKLVRGETTGGCWNGLLLGSLGTC